ncbi:MAG: sigma 54-interacting transcriptional regulator [Planctomycetes bacterium]|nr:sigma 54-interacting transcriptional regulator [Planctomycetota bacterium]
MARLIQLSGPSITPATTRKAEVTFGRDRTNDYQLGDPSTSRTHAKIAFEGGRYTLVDLGSRNGTYHNGAKVTKATPLSNGDLVKFGDPEFRFECATREHVPVIELTRDSATVTSMPQAPRPVASTQERSIGPDAAELTALRRDHEKLMLLYEIGKDVHTALDDPTALLKKSLEIVFKVLDAERAFVATVDRDSGALVYEEVRDRDGKDLDVEKEIPVSKTITHDVVKNKRAILTRDAVAEEQYRGIQSIADMKLLSAMCVPLMYRDQALGILYADNHAQRNCFSPADLEFFASLGHLVGIALGNATLFRREREEKAALIEILGQEIGMVGRKSASMQAVFEQIDRVAPSEANVIITGESGAGKELVARAIHNQSHRKAKAFVPVNCAAIPDTLLESELFGYAPNSGISGASPKGKPGKFELAHGGTIFLDEIGDMPPATQAKILRVVQDRRVERLSATEPTQVDVRILSATNRDLSEEIKAGRFREDLFYRLKVVQVHVPPLRERREDIPELVEYFVRRACARNNRFIREVQQKAMDLLQGYPWPGNVRELENAIEAAVVMSGGPVVTTDVLSERVRQGRKGIPSHLPTWDEEERQYLLRVLRHCKGVKSHAADVTGLARKTIHEKIKQHNLKPSDWGGAGDDEPEAGSD